MDKDETADWITWKQIFTGFVVVFCMASALIFGVSEAQTGRSLLWIPVSIIIAGAIVVTLLEKRAQSVYDNWLSKTGLDNALQWAAIFVLVIFSLATIGFGLVVTPI